MWDSSARRERSFVYRNLKKRGGTGEGETRWIGSERNCKGNRTCFDCDLNGCFCSNWDQSLVVAQGSACRARDYDRKHKDWATHGPIAVWAQVKYGKDALDVELVRIQSCDRQWRTLAAKGWPRMGSTGGDDFIVSRHRNHQEESGRMPCKYH